MELSQGDLVGARDIYLSEKSSFREKLCTVTVIIPTLNEEPTIVEVIAGVSKSCLGLDVSIIVADNGSVDRTAEEAKKMGTEVVVEPRKGKGLAMVRGAQVAKGDILVFVDGDGTYLGSELEDVVKPIVQGEADLVVGSRLVDKSRRERGSITRTNLIGNKIINFVFNMSTGGKFTDILSGYKAIRADLFKKFLIRSEGFEIETEIMIEGYLQRIKMLEVPISYKRRRGTETKLNPIGDGAKLIHSVILILMNIRPLFSFGVISLAFILLGLYPGLLVLYEKIVYGEVIHLPAVILASLLITAGALTLVLGLLADLIVGARFRIERLVARLGSESTSHD